MINKYIFMMSALAPESIVVVETVVFVMALGFFAVGQFAVRKNNRT